jgi:5-methylthioadenosine/S-adenosylhomocysteine deaminase
MMDLDQPNMRPMYDPISQLVYSAGAGNVDTVMVDGQLLMRHREMLTLDEEKILYMVQAAGNELIGQ